MKKKSLPKRSTESRKTIHKRKSSTVSFQRIFIIGIAVAFFITCGFFYRSTSGKAVLGASVLKPIFSQATITWQPVSGASGYDIYYKQANEKTFSNSVSNLPPNTTSYIVKNLKRRVNYQYQVAAIVNGADVWLSSMKWMSNIKPM